MCSVFYWKIKPMKNTLLKILSILGLFLSPLVLMADDCKPCEEGEPNCGGNPGSDSMSVELGE